jgi:hypothetical protein
MKNTRNEKHIAEQLKDRRDYRQTLIHRREEIENKIKATEAQIKALKERAA